MNRLSRILVAAATIALLAAPAYATNGDNLIGVGAISRSMGGVGVAAPQDALSAVFANPAAMCFAPYCPNSQTQFGGTIFSPTVKATVNGVTVKSEMEPFIIPAVGISAPINDRARFGFGAYGVSGLGVDYRNTGLDAGMGPGSGEIFTMFQVMKFAPNISYQLSPNFSIGGNIQIVYAALDLQDGTSHNYTTGMQVGAIYKFKGTSLGLSYVTGQEVDHERVADLDGLPGNDTLSLESPQNLAAGIAFYPTDGLLIEADVKWYNWADAAGYKMFDWEDQMVYAVGAQYELSSGWTLRAGYNYGESPVKVHESFDDSDMPTFQQEYLRIVGFPAIVETHYTFGAGYDFSDRFATNFGYMKGVSNTIEENGQFGTQLKSELEEDSYEFSLNWNF